jgi:fumarate hydratase class II
MGTRIEKDSLGEIRVPQDALYGAQTARAVENFPVSGVGIGRDMVRALGQVKLACARVNLALGKLEPGMAEAIQLAAKEVIEGKLDEHFPVDVFQTGSGTSSNMNANEVIANRAMQLKGIRGIHPNDHVNLGQSSNDVFPTAIHLAAMTAIEGGLLEALAELQESLSRKARAFDGIVKTGRTHLQDATPIRLGQEFSGFASQLEHGIQHLKDACSHLRELAIGGTAVGTGINTHPDFGDKVCRELSSMTAIGFREAPNHFEAQSARDAAVQASGTLKTIAAGLLKIADDIRWLGSGPRLGLGELLIPPVQPGSSIMPGKVNPVIAESLIMVCAQVIGNDTTITLGGLYGNFQLNTMMPLIARNLLEQISLLTHASRMFASKLVDGIQADSERIESLNERSLSLATALAPRLGYDRAARIAMEAHATGKTIRDVALAQAVLPASELDRLLDPVRQTHPHKA